MARPLRLPWISCIAFLSWGWIVGAFKLSSVRSGRCRQRSLLLSLSSYLKSRRPLVVGVNKYSHDASCCFVDGNTGQVLLTQAKERLSGKKHDGGDVSSVIQAGLRSLNAEVGDITHVVSNNHHYRVRPYEKRLNFASSLGYVPDSYRSELNLLPKSKHLELSHHLAHAWSALSTAPFHRGLVVVMDGMGESYRAMMEDVLDSEKDSGDYMHDLKLIRAYGAANFIGQPVSLLPGSGYREAETAYVFDSKKGLLQPVFKRWSRERSPPELYNHGFENMESIGAVYSRISSHIFGDWNACGKVMGLASWANRKPQEARDWFFPLGESSPQFDDLAIGRNFYHKHNLMSGNPVSGTFDINWNEIESLPHANRMRSEPSQFDFYANLARSVQSDLEDVVLQMLRSLREHTGEDNLVFTGGVALNSVLNGHIRCEQNLFREVYVPPAPGDEGIALGCAMYGFQRKREEEIHDERIRKDEQRPVAVSMVSPSKNSPNEKEDKDSSDLDGVFDFPRTRVNALLASVDAAQATSASNVEGSTTTSMESHHDHNHNHNHNHDHDHAHSEVDISKLVAPAVPFVQQSSFGSDAATFSPYQGFAVSDAAVDDALYDFEPWIEIELLGGAEVVIADAVQTLTSTSTDAQSGAVTGKVIAWYQGRSELGQRALGARSLLADPRHLLARTILNRDVKRREWFRPLAPSVLVEEASQWFEGLEDGEDASPYMSLTAMVKEEKRVLVPAVCHVDGSARLQTVSSSFNALYHALLRAFFDLTKVPMLLNTSLNGKDEPIVETPHDAIRTFLQATGHIDALYLGPYKITRKAFPLSTYDQGRHVNNEHNVAGIGEEVERDDEFLLQAQPMYLSEVTTSLGNVNAGVKRVRIQDGGILSYRPSSVPRGTSDGDPDTITWTELPSSLHLDILQLLQPPPTPPPAAVRTAESADAATLLLQQTKQAVEDDGALGVHEVFDALRQAYDSDDAVDQLTWQDFAKAVRWLYDHCLVSFERRVNRATDQNRDTDDSAAEDNFESDDVRAFKDLLPPGTDVLDLRGLR